MKTYASFGTQINQTQILQSADKDCQTDFSPTPYQTVQKQIPRRLEDSEIPKEKCLTYEMIHKLYLLPPLIQNYFSTTVKITFGVVLSWYFLTFLFSIKSVFQNHYSSEILLNEARIEKCNEEYHRNKCHPDTRVEALMDYCLERQVCMSGTNLDGLGMRVATSLIASSMNDLAEKLNGQAYILICVLIFGLLSIAKILSLFGKNEKIVHVPVRDLSIPAVKA